MTLGSPHSIHVNSLFVPCIIKGALSRRTLMADTVPADSHLPLVHHDRSSVRQKRPRSRVKSCAVLKYLSLVFCLLVAKEGAKNGRDDDF